MNDPIERQDAIDAMTNALWHYPNQCYKHLNEYEFAKSLAELGLKSVPSAQLKTGHKINQHQYPAKWICSECGAKHFDFSDKFCSKCGANVTDEVMLPEHKCDTCKYEKSLWFNRCADCSDYELWEAKE